MGILRIENKDGVVEIEFPPKEEKKVNEDKNPQKRKSGKQAPQGDESKSEG